MKVRSSPAQQAPSAPNPESATSSSSNIARKGFLSSLESPELAGLSRPRAVRRKEEPGHRRSASLPDMPPNVPAPTLHEMIGVDRVGALDSRFGSLQPPRNLETDGIKSWEREAPETENEPGRPLMHPNRLFVPDANGHFPRLSGGTLKNSVDLDALKSGQKQYMWSVSALGRLIIGEELPVETETEGVRHLGHPTLVGGGNARISGELRYNAETGKFVVSNRSGRYSRYEDRSPGGLDAVVAMFKEMGLDVERDQVQKYITEKKPEKLVLPSLDPSRQAEPSTKG